MLLRRCLFCPQLISNASLENYSDTVQEWFFGSKEMRFLNGAIKTFLVPWISNIFYHHYIACVCTYMLCVYMNLCWRNIFGLIQKKVYFLHRSLSVLLVYRTSRTRASTKWCEQMEWVRRVNEYIWWWCYHFTSTVLGLEILFLLLFFFHTLS